MYLLAMNYVTLLIKLPRIFMKPISYLNTFFAATSQVRLWLFLSVITNSKLGAKISCETIFGATDFPFGLQLGQSMIAA